MNVSDWSSFQAQLLSQKKITIIIILDLTERAGCIWMGGYYPGFNYSSDVVGIRGMSGKNEMKKKVSIKERGSSLLVRKRETGKERQKEREWVRRDLDREVYNGEDDDDDEPISLSISQYRVVFNPPLPSLDWRKNDN